VFVLERLHGHAHQLHCMMSLRFGSHSAHTQVNEDKSQAHARTQRESSWRFQWDAATHERFH
jgi:hypothetical protein